MRCVKVLKNLSYCASREEILKFYSNLGRGLVCSRGFHTLNDNDNGSVVKNTAFHYDSVRLYCTAKPPNEKTLMTFVEFEDVTDKKKETFLEMITLYETNFPTRKGVVDFINAALKHMKEFGVHEDLEAYRKLLNVMPKGRYVPENKIQAFYRHYPREQDCILDLLYQMTYYNVHPDLEFGTLLVNIFGESGAPTTKYYRMMYWLPKFKNKSPFPLPKPLPDDEFELAKLAIERITSVDVEMQISVYRTEKVQASIDKTWVISAQSPEQKKLLKNHDTKKPVIVEGGDHVWIGNKRVNYFVLKAEEAYIHVHEPKPLYEVDNLQSRFLNPNYEEEDKERSPHEQDDGNIYAVCATGTSTKDSLLSWIRLLQEDDNIVLKDLAILFRFKKPHSDPVPVSDALVKQDSSQKENVSSQ